MKKNLILLSLCLLMIVSLCACFADYKSAIYANWKITMPTSFKEVYDKESEASFNGDGVRYHVFTYEDDSDIDGWLEFSNQQQETIFYKDYETSISEWLEWIDGLVKYPIDYSKCEFYYDHQDDNSEIIIVIDKQAKMVWTIESFM